MARVICWDVNDMKCRRRVFKRINFWLRRGIELWYGFLSECWAEAQLKLMCLSESS
jgi:hypothetical protein